MAFGFQFFRPNGSVLFDTQWPVLTLQSKGSATDMYVPRDASARLNNSNQLDAFVASGSASGTVYRFTTAIRTPTANRGFQFFSPDGKLIVSSEFPPMKIVDFKRVNEGNQNSHTVNVPSGKTYAVVEIASVASGEPYNIVHEPAQPPSYEEWWSYRWRNFGIRPVWSGSTIRFNSVQWADGTIYESDTGTIQPVDEYLKYDCMIVDVTGL